MTLLQAQRKKITLGGDGSMRKRTSIAFLAFALALMIGIPSSFGQTTDIKVDGEVIKGYIKWMSTDEMEGRKSGAEGYRLAAEWAAAKFEEWGLEPAGENGTYFQKVPIRGYTQNLGMPELRVGRTMFMMEEGDFQLNSASTVGTNVRAEVVFVGTGISARRKGLDEYTNIDVKGKVVLALKGSPLDVAAAGGRGGSMGPGQIDVPDLTEDFTAESTDAAKIKTAFDKGAAAILLFDPNPPAPAAAAGQRGQRNRGGQRGAAGPALEFDRDFLAYTIDGRVFRAIMKPDRQESANGFNRRLTVMRQAIKRGDACSTELGIRVRLAGYEKVEIINEELDNVYARNVMAKIEGADPELKNQYVIMGGHMDHLGVRNGLVYNGADDNASGTATAMEIGRLLKKANFKPKRTIIFCCWCGEEMGLIGSTYYTNNPCDGVTMDQVVTYFNMDMIGLGDKIGAPGALNFPTIWEVIKRDQEADVIGAVLPRTGGPGGSDHSGFITKGIEALALMTSGGVGHPSYHQPEDDTVYISAEILRKTGQFVLQGTVNLANETEVELLIPNRLALYNAVNVRIPNINPELEGSTWGYLEIAADDKEELEELVADVEQNPRKNIGQGIKNLELFEGDLDLLKKASDALGIGRVDITNDAWLADRGLSEEGQNTLAALEASNVAVNLVSPSPRLLRSVLRAATKPFAVTGDYALNERMYEQLNEKKVVLGVKFEPDNVERSIGRLEATKKALGDSDNIVLFITSAEGLDKAKTEMYMGLIEAGWETSEIGGGGGRRGGGGTGITGGNLGVLNPPQQGRIIRLSR